MPGTPPKPTLCKRCNVSLQIDDSFLKKSLETSDTSDLYLGGRDMFMKETIGLSVVFNCLVFTDGNQMTALV